MFAKLKTRHLTLATAAAGALLALAGGCAQQDLYEPPGSPYQVVGRLAMPSVIENVAILGETAFLAGGEAGIYSVDLSVPSAPRLEMLLHALRYADDIEVARFYTDGILMDIAFLLDPSEGILIYDVTDPSNMIQLSQNPVAWGANGIAVDQPADPGEPLSIYMADDWKGIYAWTFDPANPTAFESLGYGITTNGKTYGIALHGGFGYVADNELGLCVLDVDPFYDGFISSWADTPGNARDIAIEGDCAFIADGVEGLAIFRLHGGDTPEKIAQYDLNGFSEAIAVRDGLCAIAANGAGVHFLDVNEPEAPIYLGSTATSYAVGVVLASDGHCLVADEDDGLLVLGGRGPFSDDTPPAPIPDLFAEPTGVNSIDLFWTVTGDDGFDGTAAAVEIRWSGDPIIDEESWDAATPVEGVPAPEAAGTSMSGVFDGFERNQTYHFAARVIDDEGLVSLLSNPTSATTLDQIVLRNGRVTPLAAPPGTTFEFEVEVLWGLPLSDTEVIIDGTPFTMAPGGGRWYRYESSDFEVGLHHHAFRFTAETSPDARFPDVGEIVGPATGFIMGSPDSELGRREDEVRHVVVITLDLIGSPYEVTQAEWEEVMDPVAYPNPSQHVGADRPVDTVSWYDAIAYCNERSLAEGLTPAYTIDDTGVTWNQEADGWRLPTEAEWEYLARAGTSTALYNGELVNGYCQLDTNLDAIGWYCGNSPQGPQPVGLKEPNAFGLHDMSGNLREWCWDWYGPLGEELEIDPEGPLTGDLKVCRGGSWYFTSQECRSAARGTMPPDSVDDTVGFRVVRTNFGP